jgi:hypothetical protein
MTVEMPFLSSPHHQTCPIRSAPPLVVGAIAILWEKKEGTFESGQNETRLEGFVDAYMTLAMIVCCNFLLGWPILFFGHFRRWESFVLPPTTHHWWILNWNGLVEYSFHASCAVDIYMTSPLVTSIMAPLTIPCFLGSRPNVVSFFKYNFDCIRGRSLGMAGSSGHFVGLGAFGNQAESHQVFLVLLLIQESGTKEKGG